MAAFLAAGGVPGPWQLLWIVVAMAAARTGALCLNRYADAELDRQNPRTRHWPVPRRLVAKQQVLGLGIFAWAVFMLAAYMLRPFLVFLAPLAIFVFTIYPYSKRFTWASHFINGFCLGMAPAGAWLAITGRLDWTPIIILLAVTVWVAGFDILYALEDLEFDLNAGLKSFPQRYGVRSSFIAARLLHLVMVLLLLSLYFLLDLGTIYLTGLALASLLLLYEHIFLKGKDPSRVEGAFFTVNGFVSVILALFTMIEVVS
jgi:4-hydroxybenzoate polyprenyltransferase